MLNHSFNCSMIWKKNLYMSAIIRLKQMLINGSKTAYFNYMKINTNHWLTKLRNRKNCYKSNCNSLKRLTKQNRRENCTNSANYKKPSIGLISRLKMKYFKLYLKKSKKHLKQITNLYLLFKLNRSLRSRLLILMYYRFTWTFSILYINKT